MDKSLRKIMYIEDESDIVAIAEIALKDIGGLEIQCCQSGKEALEKAPIFKPDLFLIDVMMPEMDGPTTFLELRKNPIIADVPAIFMTAKVQSAEIKEYLDLGALGVISKPFDPITLSETIKKIWKAKYGQ